MPIVRGPRRAVPAQTDVQRHAAEATAPVDDALNDGPTIIDQLVDEELAKPAPEPETGAAKVDLASVVPTGTLLESNGVVRMGPFSISTMDGGLSVKFDPTDEAGATTGESTLLRHFISTPGGEAGVEIIVLNAMDWQRVSGQQKADKTEEIQQVEAAETGTPETDATTTDDERNSET